jgi:DUF971 family protein
MAETVDSEVLKLAEGEANYHARYDPTTGEVIVEGESLTDKTKSVLKKIDPYELRIKCKCAACIDEMDGRQILKLEEVPKDVFPTNIVKKGHYAVAIVWSDGHRSSIYLFDRLLSNEFKS